MSATLPSADELAQEFSAICEIFESGEASPTDRQTLRALWGKLVQKMSQFEKAIRDFEAAHRAKACSLSFEDADGKVIMARKFDHDIDVLLEVDSPGCVKLYELAKGHARNFARYIAFIEFLLKETAAPDQLVGGMDHTVVHTLMGKEEEKKPAKKAKKETKTEEIVTPQPEQAPPEPQKQEAPAESEEDSFLQGSNKSTFQKLRDGDIAKK